MNSRQQQLDAFNRLLDIMDDLREKCPWDKKQTLESLRHLTIEEVYEVGDAILDNDLDELKKELGDVLLHIVFYSKIGSEKKVFDIADVANGISDKLIERHPHIYGDVVAENEEQRIQDKVAGVGFDWENSQQVWEKVQEEINELNQEIKKGTQENIEKEFGDVLFSLINYARFIKINPENALEKTNKKFINRFQYIEEKAKEKNVNISDMSLSEMDKFWNEAKKFFR